jgi:hypothetical protein
MVRLDKYGQVGGIVHYQAIRDGDIVECWGDMDKDIQEAEEEQEIADKHPRKPPSLVTTSLLAYHPSRHQSSSVVTYKSLASD